LLATGSISGITNAGSHRLPVFEDCQPCDAAGFMEGRFCGQIVKAGDPSLLGCQVIGNYRLRFDPSREGGSGAVQGALEGLVTCECVGEPPRLCVDFQGLPTGGGSNPRIEQDVSFEVRDGAGSLPPTTQIRTEGAFTGLDCGFRTEIQLPMECSAVDVRLVHFAQPARITAFGSSGAVAGTAVMSGPQRQAETLRVAGDIVRVAVEASQDETLLLEFCYEPRRA
jgi:hypothetical protein